jgi:hypothetical protein
MLVGDVDGDGVPDIVARTGVEGVALTSVYVSTAKHPAPANPILGCGTLTPAACAKLPAGF